MPEKRVALYCRVAHKDQLAMNLQLSQLRRFAETRGLSPCVAYLDNGYSGSSDDRPAFQRMNADIENREICMVLMTYMSRLGRQFENVHNWLRKTSLLQVPVIFTEEPGTMKLLIDIVKDMPHRQSLPNKKEGA